MNEKELYAAICMILSDRPVEKIDAIFFHGRGVDDHDGLFELSTSFYKDGLAKFIVINGFDGFLNAPGRGFYLSEFVTRRVLRPYIVLSDAASNTKEENDAFVKLSRCKNWRSAAILTQPHQILRAFLGAINSMRKQNYLMRLYAIFPHSTLWFKHVFGSQGAENKERFEHIFEELKRIPIYQEKGDLCTFSEFFEYIKNRDKIP
ncbi:MAG: hypothetical protein AAB522_03390 [Patescibacteria group bacterium]